MSERIVEGVPNDELEEFCRRERLMGATKCEVQNRGPQTSDVLLEYPDE